MHKNSLHCSHCMLQCAVLQCSTNAHDVSSVLNIHITPADVISYCPILQAIGLFDGVNSVALEATHVWDVIPGDRVASVILATAAAMSAGLTIGGCGVRKHTPATAAAPAGADTLFPSTKPIQSAAANGTDTMRGSRTADTIAPAPSGLAAVPKRTVTASEPSPKGRLPAVGELSISVDSPSSVLDGHAEQQQQQQQQQQQPFQEQQKQPLLVVHACTTTLYPLSYLETQRSFAEFIEKHPSPFKLPGADNTFRVRDRQAGLYSWMVFALHASLAQAVHAISVHQNTSISHVVGAQ